MEGFSFVTPVTGLNRPNTGKEDAADGILHVFSTMQKSNNNNNISTFTLLM
jgi:hypothetical protein